MSGQPTQGSEGGGEADAGTYEAYATPAPPALVDLNITKTSALQSNIDNKMLSYKKLCIERPEILAHLDFKPISQDSISDLTYVSENDQIFSERVLKRKIELQAALHGLNEAATADPESYSAALNQYNAALAAAAAEISLLKVAFTFKTYATSAVSFTDFCKNYTFDTSKFKQNPLEDIGYTVEDYMERTMLAPATQYSSLLDLSADASALLQFLSDLSFMCCYGAPSTVKQNGAFNFNSTFESENNKVNTIVSVKQSTDTLKQNMVDSGLSGIIRASRDLTASFQIGKVALGEGNEDQDLKNILLEYLPEDFFSSIDRPEPLRSLYSYFVGWDPYAQNIKDPSYYDPEMKVLYYVPDFKNYEDGIVSHIFTSNEAVKISSNTDEYITSVDVQFNSAGQLEIPPSGLNTKSKEFVGINELVNQAFSNDPIDFTEYKNEVDPLAKNIKTFSTAYKKLFKLLDQKGNLRSVTATIASDEHPSSPSSIFITAQKIFAEKWHANAASGAGALLDGNSGYLAAANNSQAAATAWGSKVHQSFASFYMAEDPDTCKQILRKFIEDYFNGYLTLAGDSSTEVVGDETIAVRPNEIPGTNATKNLSQSRGALYSYLVGIFESGRQTRMSNTSATQFTGPTGDGSTSYYGQFKLGRYLRNSIYYENEEGETAEEAAQRIAEGGNINYAAVAADREFDPDTDYTTPPVDSTGDYIITAPLPVWIAPSAYNGARNHHGFSGIQYNVDSASSVQSVEVRSSAGGVLEQTYGVTRGDSVTRDPLEYSYYYDRIHGSTASTISADRGGGEGYYSEPNYEGLIELQHFYQYVSKDRDGQIVPLALIPIAGQIIDMVMTLLYETLGQVLEISQNTTNQFPNADIHSAPYQTQEFTTSNSLITNYPFGNMAAGFGSLQSSNKTYWVPTLEAIRKTCMRPGDKTTWYSSSEMTTLTDNIIDIFSTLAQPLLDVLEIEKYGAINTPLGPGTKWSSIPYNGWEPLTFWEARRSSGYWSSELAYPASPDSGGKSLDDKIAYIGRCQSRFFKPKQSYEYNHISRDLSEYLDNADKGSYGGEGGWAFEAYQEDFVEYINGTPNSTDYLLNTQGGFRFHVLEYATEGYDASPYYGLTSNSSTITIQDVKNYLTLKATANYWTGHSSDSDDAAYNVIPWGNYFEYVEGYYINLWHYATTEYIQEFDRFCETLIKLVDEDRKLSVGLDILDGYADRLSNYALKAVDGLTPDDGESALTDLLGNLSATERGTWVLQNLTQDQLNLKSAALQAVQGAENASYISKCDIINDNEVNAIRYMLSQGNNGRDGKNIIVTTIGLPSGLMSNLNLPAARENRYQPKIDGNDITEVDYSPLIYVKAQPSLLTLPQLVALPKIYRFDTEVFVLPGAFEDIDFSEVVDFDDIVKKTKFTRYRYIVKDSSSGIVNYDVSVTFTLEEEFTDAEIEEVFDIYSNILSSYLLEKYYEIIIGFAAAEYDFGTAGEGLQLPVEEYALDLAGALSSIYSDLTTGDDAVGDDVASQIFYSSENITQLSYATLNPTLGSITSISNYSSIVKAFDQSPEAVELTTGASSLFNAFTNASSSNLFSASSMRDRIISANYFDRVFMINLDPDDIEIYGVEPLKSYWTNVTGLTLLESVVENYQTLLEHLQGLNQLTTYRDADVDSAVITDQLLNGAVSIVNYPADSSLDKGEITFAEVRFSVTKDPVVAKEDSTLLDRSTALDYSYSIKRS